jgi:hypothetical protein
MLLNAGLQLPHLVLIFCTKTRSTVTPSADSHFAIRSGTAVVVSLGAQSVEGTADLLRGIAVSGQVGREQPFLDVAVALLREPFPG